MDNLNDPTLRRIRKKKKSDAKPVGGLSYKARDALRGVIGLVLLVGVGLLIWLWYWWTTTGTWNALRKEMPDYVELKKGDPMGQVSPVKKKLWPPRATLKPTAGALCFMATGSTV